MFNRILGMHSRKIHQLSLKMARKIIKQHNQLVFQREFGCKSDRTIALLFQSYEAEMAEALVCADFDFYKFCQIFTLEKVFCGTLENPSLDDMVESILTLEEHPLFKDVLSDAQEVVSKLHQITDEHLSTHEFKPAA